MRILLGKTPEEYVVPLSIGPRSRRAAKKRNELPPELRGRNSGTRWLPNLKPLAQSRATIVRDVNRIFGRAVCFLAVFVELGGGLS